MPHDTGRNDAQRAGANPSSGPIATLGLAAARIKTNLTLEQIADTTKISPLFLRAIEAEQFERLPGGIFSTSYLRQYARCIGYDETLLLARFHEIMDPEPEVIAPETASHKPSAAGLRQLLGWLRIALPAQLTR